MMKDESVRRGIEPRQIRDIESAMGFMPGSLSKYTGRNVKIIIKSPKKFRGKSGMVYRNE